MITLNLNKINIKMLENDYKMENLIENYYNFCNCNDFSDLECPCCKHKNTLHFHKSYSRNLTYVENGQKRDIIINIVVLVCVNCQKNGNTQKYHALLPFFIFPYHVYDAGTILSALKDYFYKKKMKEIIDSIQITHKLFYDWLKKFYTYSLSSSIILSMPRDPKLLLNKICEDSQSFLTRFYYDYYHPFFLFRFTCVPLCIGR